MDRIAVADMVVGDYVIPKGQTILVSQYWMHRDPRYWPDAEEFRPDRWLDDAGAFTDKIVPRGVYFPFGFAARKCIGDRFALTESAMAMAELGRRWHVIPLDPSDIVPKPSVTLRPSTSMPSLLRRRDL
jgi:cytochrome P450